MPRNSARLSDSVNIAAVVVTWNGMAWIDACLQSLLVSEQPVKVIVVDNASSDGTAGHVSGRYGGVEVLASDDNQGFARANNRGMRLALDQGADFVFLLNQDAVVKPDTMGKLIRAQSAEPGFGVVSPVHLNGAGNGLDENFEQYGLRSAFGSTSDPPDVEKGTALIEVTFVNAAAWMVSRACLETIGGFHPAFFMYGEDHEFLNRARHAGFRAGILPGSFIHHHRDRQPPPKSGVRKNLTSRYLANEARIIVLDPGLTDDRKRSRLLRLYWRTVLRSVRFLEPRGPLLLRDIRQAARQARKLGPEAALHDLNKPSES